MICSLRRETRIELTMYIDKLYVIINNVVIISSVLVHLRIESKLRNNKWSIGIPLDQDSHGLSERALYPYY